MRELAPWNGTLPFGPKFNFKLEHKRATVASEHDAVDDDVDGWLRRLMSLGQSHCDTE